MDFEMLNDFQKLAEVLNYTVAAEQLYTTEATLSRHIKKLEAEIGGELFHRSTRHIELTDLGAALLPYAKESVKLNASIQGVVLENQKKKSVIFNVLASSSFDDYINYPTLMQIFTQKYPNVKINFLPLNGFYKEAFKNNDCDIGFFSELPGTSSPDYSSISLYHDRLMAILPPNHRFKSRSSVSLNELENEEFILLGQGTPMYNLCVSACQKSGFEPNISLTMHSGSAIFEMIKNGAGISIGSSKIVELLLTHSEKLKLILCPIEPEIQTSFNLVFPKHPNKNATNFINYFIEHKDEYMKV